MKKPLLLTAVVALALLAACGKQGGAGASSSSSGARDENDVDLVVGANYYFESKDNDGNISYKYGSWLQAGDTVLILPGEVKTVKVFDSKGNQVNDMIGPARITSSAANKKDVGKDVFVSRYYIIPHQRAGVVIAADKAPVYDGLKPLNVTKKVLPRLTLLAVAPLVEKDNPLKRRRFVAYNVTQPDGQVFKAGSWSEFYVDDANVSTSKSDVGVAKVILGMPKVDKSQWGIVVSATEQQYPDSILLDDARAMIAQAGQSPSPAPSSRPTENVALKAMVNGDNVPVRTEPNESVGDVIGNLGAGTEIDVTAQTVDSYSIGDQTARWFKIKSGDLEGWVFGASLSIE